MKLKTEFSNQFRVCTAYSVSEDNFVVILKIPSGEHPIYARRLAKAVAHAISHNLTAAGHPTILEIDGEKIRSAKPEANHG